MKDVRDPKAIVTIPEPEHDNSDVASSTDCALPLFTPNLQDLYAALAKAQGEMRIAGLTSENPFFKSRYADLAELKRASTPSLSKFGLSVSFQIITDEQGKTMLYATLAHSSGQFVRSKMRVVPLKNDPQSMGSMISYYKRYMYAMLTGVVSSDEDDDGEKAMKEARDEFVKGTSLKPKYNPLKSGQTITPEQLDELEYELAEYPDLAEEVKTKLDLGALADMPKEIFRTAIERVREIKAIRNGKK